MEYKIEYLPREVWRGHILHMDYTAREHYKVEITSAPGVSFAVTMMREPFCEPHEVTSEMYDFPDRLYEDYRPDAEAYGIIDTANKDDGGPLLGVIEVEAEEWSNRLRVTELWVGESHRRRGIGHALMEHAKSMARRDGRRALILETQTNNTNAISFYLHEGLDIFGFDRCCYKNNDVERGEVRMELGCFFGD